MWPGGLEPEQYSTLNLIAHCRRGELGYNLATCRECHYRQWYASSCGDRHCPMCLGPRQAQWSAKVCGRLPDCPHFHVVFSPPAELWGVFERNYRVIAGEFFAAVSETLQQFIRNNWRCERGAYLAVLHTWGSRLNWHPHLHVLVGSGAVTPAGRWKTARKGYLFPVRAMSKVFAAIFLRRLEALDADPRMEWPPELQSVEQRRDWRVMLCGRSWNVFSKPTLGNTRAVVRYLARYTSRIAMANQRLSGVDEDRRRVSFRWKDYRDGGKQKEETLEGRTFLRRFARHLVPKGLRRIRYYGLLCGKAGRYKEAPGAPQSTMAESAPPSGRKDCKMCGKNAWRYLMFLTPRVFLLHLLPSVRSFSLGMPRAGP